MYLYTFNRNFAVHSFGNKSFDSHLKTKTLKIDSDKIYCHFCTKLLKMFASAIVFEARLAHFHCWRSIKIFSNGLA